MSGRAHIRARLIALTLVLAGAAVPVWAQGQPAPGALPEGATSAASGPASPPPEAPSPTSAPEPIRTDRARIGLPPEPDADAPPDPAAPAADKPETIVAGLSRDAVSITASFNGSEILIFGAVKRSAPVPEAGLGVIVTVQGPLRSVKVRKKERRFGVWVNTQSLRIGAAPEFYAVATSAPLSTMLSEQDDTRYRVSLPLALRAFAGPVEVEDSTAFTEAMVRLRESSGQYRLDEGHVALIDETLFRADIALPAQLTEGNYKARILLVREGRVIDTQQAVIEVRKVGLERWLYRLALQQPFWYGILSLGLAVLAGWAASALFLMFRRR